MTCLDQQIPSRITNDQTEYIKIKEGKATESNNAKRNKQSRATLLKNRTISVKQGQAEQHFQTWDALLFLPKAT